MKWDEAKVWVGPTVVIAAIVVAYSITHLRISSLSDEVSDLRKRIVSVDEKFERSAQQMSSVSAELASIKASMAKSQDRFPGSAPTAEPVRPASTAPRRR